MHLQPMSEFDFPCIRFWTGSRQLSLGARVAHFAWG